MGLVEFGQRLENLSRSVDTTIRLGLAFVVAATGAACEANAAKAPTKAPQAQETQVSIPPILTPIVSGIAVTPEATTPPSPIATETQIPPTVTVKPIDTATAIATETPKPPENPLPKYGVFFGNVTDPATGAKVAEMVMASIPQVGGGDEIFVYYISSPDKNGNRIHGGLQLKPFNIEGTHFELGWMQDAKTIEIIKKAGGKPSDPQKYFTGNYDPTKKIIEGDTTYGINGKHSLKYAGKGQADIRQFMARIINDMSSDQPTTPDKELAQLAKNPTFRVNPDRWP